MIVRFGDGLVGFEIDDDSALARSILRREQLDASAADPAEREWDSESRKSAYSTVADPDDESYCEGCDSEVVYSGPDDEHGTCNCASRI